MTGGVAAILLRRVFQPVRSVGHVVRETYLVLIGERDQVLCTKVQFPWMTCIRSVNILICAWLVTYYWMDKMQLKVRIDS